MEIQTIQKQFNEILKYSQGIADPQTDDLFLNWQNNKVKAFEKFFPEGKYIYEFPEKVTFIPDHSTLEYEYTKLTNDITIPSELRCFLHAVENDFYSNILSKDYVCENFTIQKGTKIIKAFKYFIKDPQALTFLQDKASTLIQKNKIEGTLCLSIHPLDFLSLSENNHNWRSCHSLDGCYRAGNLSYMADSSTLICYLKSECDVPISGFPSSISWNSKKWRMLLFMSENQEMMFAGRQYPFSLESSILNQVSKLLDYNQDFSINKWTEWDNSYITEFNSDTFGRVVLQDKYLVGQKCGLTTLSNYMNEPIIPLHYNDLLWSSTYTEPYYRYKIHWLGHPEVWQKKKQEIFNIGHNVKCIQCGKELIHKDTESMLCEECYDGKSMFTCDYCGNLCSEEDEEMIEVNGLNVCEYCYNNNVFTCIKCGQRVFRAEGRMSEEGFVCYHCTPPNIECIPLTPVSFE